MERWRLFVALAAALGALPLLAIDNVSSAEGRDESPKVEVLGTSTERSDGALDLLASRASSWAVAREEIRVRTIDEALGLEAQANAEAAAVAAENARLSAEAAQGDQDNMALNLYHMRGAGQWPVCGNALL